MLPLLLIVGCLEVVKEEFTEAPKDTVSAEPCLDDSNCDDQNPCTVDTCVEGFGCVHAPCGDWTSSPCKKDGVCAQDGGAATCDVATGTWSCDYSAIASYEGDETLCDGKDNDCDGVVDEGLTTTIIEANCSIEGVCYDAARQLIGVPADDVPTAPCVDGKWACDYSWVGTYEANEESCDNLDNDCDGQTDEDLKRPIDYDCGKGNVGVCWPGAPSVCDKGEWACQTAEIPAFEAGAEVTCDDGLDNDCDGKIDSADDDC